MGRRRFDAQFGCGTALAEIMTVAQVKEMLAKGTEGRLAATAYAQGVFDGMVAMESLNRKQGAAKQEFCGLFEAEAAGRPITHPTYEIEQLLAAWAQQELPMGAPFPDLVLSYLSKQHGC